MTDNVIIAAIGIIPSIVSATAAVIIFKRQAENHISMNKKVDILTQQTDGITESLVKASGIVEFAKGVEKGVKDEKDKNGV
jgi:hypothetical protein